jgi:ribonuclease R
MSKKSRKKKSAGASQQNLHNLILNFLAGARGRAYSVKQLAKKLGLKKEAEQQNLYQALHTLAEQGKIRQLDNGSFTLPPQEKTLTGVVDHVSSRFAYVNVGEDTPDVFVRTQDLNTAVDGDTVRLVLLPGSHGEHPVGRVTEVLQRNRTRFVGRLQRTKNMGFVIPDFRKIHQDFVVYPEHLKGARENDKVVVEVTNWGRPGENPVARVVEILGRAGENEAEIHSIMAEFGLPFRFPEAVEQEARKIDEGITPAEIKKRRDFRQITTFTIDPEDAKDFDDALSIETLPNGNYRVGIHIADVTHYVKPNSALDQEAYDRATSVYLVDRTIPMLPERLSNELCSLRPHEDKLTFSAVFELDKQAHLVNEWFGRTIIHSKYRFTYEEAQDVLETGKGPFATELKILNELAKKLRKERFARGAVNFETTEVKFKLDEKGHPLAVIPKIRKDAHKLIEEFMLLANKRVATFVFSLGKRSKNSEGQHEGKTFVYRIHDYPDPEKVKDFAVFARQFGHRLQIDERSISRSLNKLMDEIEGKPEQNVLQQLAVRAMAKAKYSTEPKGHFGLAFDHYTHFTSPIRRYPDVLVHRLLYHYLNKGKSVNKAEYEAMCVHASEREKRAADAERASIKYKQVEYMSLMAPDKVFDGIISGVTEWGIYVELIETKCEGMIRLADLNDDYYEYDEKNYCVVGRRTRKIYTLGDQIRVKVKKTDIDRRLIDLVLAKTK